MNTHRLCAAALAACLLVSAPAGAADLTGTTGVSPSSWAEADIQTAAEQNLVPSALYGHWQQNVTRQQFADLMAALLRKNGYDFDAVALKSTFTDTESNNVRRLCTLGVMTGTSANTFSPSAAITREAVAAVALRLASSVLKPKPYPDQYADTSFSDGEQISSWASEAVSFCSGSGILSGTGPDTFAPQATMTVEQAALTTLRLFQYAQTMQSTPLTMTPGGVSMLYSNNPEAFTPKEFEGDGVYTADADLTDGQTIDTEYYHCNWMGSYQPMILGVAVTNTGGGMASVDIERHGVGIGTNGTVISETCYEQFFGDNTPETVQLGSGESKLLLQATLPGGEILNARARLTIHGKGVNVRIVALKKLIPTNYLNTLPRGIDDDNGRTAGIFKYSERSTSVDASAVKNFTLCGNTPTLRALNSGEFPQNIGDPLAVSYKGMAHMAYYLDGNFATVYHLNFANADGKTLYIRPNDASPGAYTGHYYIRTAGGSWQAVTGTADDPVKLTLSDGTLDFLMLGGNYGNIGFHIVS